MEAIIVAAISAVSAITIAVVQLVNVQRQKARDAQEKEVRESDADERRQRQADVDARDARREEVLLQLLKGNQVNGELAHATALAVKRGECNGEMEESLRDYDKYVNELNAFSARLGAASFKK